MHGHGSWVESRATPPENVQNPPDMVTAKLAALQASSFVSPRLALRSALSVKASEGRVSVIDGFEALDVPRTRTIVDMLGSVGVEGRTLLVLAAANEMVSRSAANLPWAKTILASNLNLYDIFTHDHVVIAKDALELIEETFA
jgi:large subunit ribosomal protein L4